jgi:hypothetical protein
MNRRKERIRRRKRKSLFATDELTANSGMC